MITRYDPWILELDYEFGGNVRDANESKLKETGLSDLMPNYQIGDQKAPLTNRCFLQSGTQNFHGFSSLVHITAIDLANKKLVSSQCVIKYRVLPIFRLSIRLPSRLISQSFCGVAGFSTFTNSIFTWLFVG